MAVLDRATRRLVDGLRARVKFLTVLVVVLAIALTVMTVLYINKDVEKPDDKTVSGGTTSQSDKASSDDATLSGEQSSESSSTSSEDDKSSTSEDKSSSSGKPSSSESTAVNATAVPGDSVDSWNLKLVNGKNPLPKGYTLTTEKIKPSYARDVGMKFDAKAVSYLNAMCAAAEKDGINLLVISGFRTNAKQTSLYNNQVNKQKSKYPDKTDEEIKKIAATISAYPGTSEHELGLAVDFNSVEESFENTRHFQWLKAHAAEYGFVMRYAKEKQDITGVIYEPWHYRYVGEKHAKKMNELGYCLEEYIEYLKKGGK